MDVNEKKTHRAAVGLWGMETNSPIPEATGGRTQEAGTQGRISHLNPTEAEAMKRGGENRSDPRGGYNFLIATVTNYHKLRVSKQSKLSTLQLEVLK